MSIITCYARLSQSQLDSLVSTPERFQTLFQSVPDGAEVMDIDKAGGVIAWLLSPCKRAEQMEFANTMAEDLGDDIPFASPPSPPPLDSLLIAIEGRGPRKQKRLEAGYGPACLFEPAEVVEFAKLIGVVDEAKLREHLDFPLMDRLYLDLEYWEEEGEEMFNEYVLPLFQRLKDFYVAASANGQCVLVWYS